ncbi:hypothetical protein KAX75_10590 [candidate division WOR-3 bacterium]|nr:hypothetical protein [candidate division WOR-3 bacterium]
MYDIIGVRREDKSPWERRVPLVPQDVKRLFNEYHIKTLLQPSDIRIFPDKDYVDVGGEVKEDITDCPLVFAVKEIPIDFFSPHKTYIFFSHTVKGQSYNMLMLKRMMELKCNLIDYEKIEDRNGRRLIAFGRFAGIAGMMDTLWAFGKRLEWEGIKNPFLRIKRTYEYSKIEEVKNHLNQIGKDITEKGFDDVLSPLIFAITGYGNVSGGVQEILDCLPVEEIRPEEIPNIDSPSNRVIYKSVFKEKDMVESISGESFNLTDYYEHPEKYRSRFHSFVHYLAIIINCIYWEEKYPRFVTKKYLKQLYESESPRLKVIGDISCDIEGAIECTLHSTTPDCPIFTYDPFTQTAKDGCEGKGPVIMAIDNLPCEIPVESSIHFSNTLMRFIPDVVKADFSKSFENCNLPCEIKNGVILYGGELTDNFKYLEKYLKE